MTGGPKWVRRGLSKADYGQLLAKARQLKVTASNQLGKVQQLSHQGRESKEAGLLRLHREVWLQEWQLLARKRGVVEEELKRWRDAIFERCRKEEEGTTQRQWAEEITTWEAELAGERERFERDTLRPVRQIVEKLKSWVESREIIEAEHVGVPGSEEVGGEVCGVRRRLGRVWGELEEECVLLHGYLTTARSAWGGEDGGEEEERERERSKGNWEEERRRRGSTEAVGEEEEKWSVGKDGGGGLPAILLGCSNWELRKSLAHEFSALDSHYQDVLEKLKDKHRDALR